MLESTYSLMYYQRIKGTYKQPKVTYHSFSCICPECLYSDYAAADWTSYRKIAVEGIPLWTPL